MPPYFYGVGTSLWDADSHDNLNSPQKPTRLGYLMRSLTRQEYATYPMATKDGNHRPSPLGDLGNADRMQQ